MGENATYLEKGDYLITLEYLNKPLACNLLVTIVLDGFKIFD